MSAVAKLIPDFMTTSEVFERVATRVAAARLDPNKLAVLNSLDLPIAIVDAVDNAIVWLNHSACVFFGGENFDALRPYLPRADALLGESPMVVQSRLAVKKSHRTQREIHIVDMHAIVDMSIRTFGLDDGHSHLLVQLHPVTPPSTEMVLGMMAMKHAPLVIAAFSPEGMGYICNELARQTFGTAFSLRSLFARLSDYETFIRLLDAHSDSAGEYLLYTSSGKRWFALDARSIRDPRTGQVVTMLCAQDISGRLQAERAREDLVSVISHELRTPMTAIRGAVELLAGGIGGSGADLSSELLQIASANVRRLSQMINDLLDVRKLANGRISICMEPCDLQKILNTVVELQQVVAQEKQVKLVLAAEQPLPILGDEGRLQQVLLNLLSNAIKYSPSGACVRITGLADEVAVRVSVLDEGPGIPETFQEQIFEQFSQVDSSTTRSHSGIGLGLYMAKTLIDLHGGALCFENRPEGGATFTFELARHATHQD